MLSRLAGGIGTRGPGESKLEMNRRHIRERMTELRRRLDAVEKQRELRRKSREKNEIPVVALVGYTNAGKSTLLNQMTGSDVYVQDQLFATLDAVSRRIETAEHTPFLLVDTVGFIRKLPHALVSAFRSTLEEAVLADVLVTSTTAHRRKSRSSMTRCCKCCLTSARRSSRALRSSTSATCTPMRRARRC